LLPAGDILEGGRDTAAHLHGCGVDRLRRAKPWRGGAECAQQENRLDQVAPRLLDR
jgi:hypothetical protein